MENIDTIRESLIYSTLYVQTVPQNIYQHKPISSFWFPDFEFQMNTYSGSNIECHKVIQKDKVKHKLIQI